MRKNDVTKLYEKMTVKERAKMAFESLCYGDTESAKKIAISVPRYTYRMADYEFKNPLDGYFQVAHIWSSEYWKSYAKMVAIIGLQASKLSQNVDYQDDIENEELDRLHSLWEHRLFALGVILKALEKSHNISIETLPQFADAHTIYGLELEVEYLEGDAREYYDMHLAQFVSFIDGTDVSNEVENYFSKKH